MKKRRADAFRFILIFRFSTFCSLCRGNRDTGCTWWPSIPEWWPRRSSRSWWWSSHRLFVSWCGKPLSPNFPYKWLQRFCERENIPFHGLHAFRHFVATQALVDGVDAKSVSAMLGHSQTSTTLNIYAHAVRQAQTRALNSIAAQLESD